MSSSRGGELRALLEDERRFRERVVASRIEAAALATPAGQAAVLAYTLLASVILAAAVLALGDPFSVQAAVDALVIVVAGAGMFALHAHRREQRDRACVVVARQPTGVCERCGPGLVFKLEQPIACERCGDVASDEAIARMIEEARAARMASISQVLDLARVPEEMALTQQGAIVAGALATRGREIGPSAAGSSTRDTRPRYSSLLQLDYAQAASRSRVIDWFQQVWGEPPPDSLPIEEILGPSRNVAIGRTSGREVMIVETSSYQALDVLLSISIETSPRRRSETFVFMRGADGAPVTRAPLPWTFHRATPGLVLQRTCEIAEHASDTRRDEDILELCNWLAKERSTSQ